MSGRSGPPSGAVLALLAAAQFAVAVDFTVVYVALPVIGRDLGLGQQDLQWVVTAYGLTFGGFLLLAGRASDLLGHRSIFVAGHLVFGTSSALAAVAPGPVVLLVARAVQGCGAALLVPATLGLLHTTFPAGTARHRALAVWGAAGASGGAAGVVLGGVATSSLGWPSIFLANLPISLASALCATLWLPASSARRPVAPSDVLGAAGVTAGGALLIYALGLGSKGGSPAAVLGSAAGAAAGLAAFFAYELGTADPLLPRRLLRSPVLVSTAAVTFIFYASLNNQLYLLTVRLQDVVGRSAAETGYLIVPHCLAIAGGAALGGRLTNRRGGRTTAAIGMASAVVGVLVLTAAADGARMNLGPTLSGLVISGLGQGTAWTGIWAAVTSSAADDEQGVTSGAVSAVGQLGQALGLAVLAAVLVAGHGASPVTDMDVQRALLVLAGGAVLGVFGALSIPRIIRTPGHPVGSNRR